MNVFGVRTELLYMLGITYALLGRQAVYEPIFSFEDNLLTKIYYIINRSRMVVRE